MKTKINEVQGYFKYKLLTGDFEVEDVDEYVVKVIIDDKYKFSMWVGNIDHPALTKLYPNQYNFMHPDFTEEERVMLSSVFAPRAIKFRRTVLLAQKRKELAELEKEIAG